MSLDFDEIANKMQKCVDSFHEELIKFRTGRAHPNLLDQIMVIYHGTPTLLKQIASISVLDSRTLQVAPWDKSQITAIEKAILNSNLGLNPNNNNGIIRIPLPQLTQDRRQELVRLAKNYAENSRIAVRNIRRDKNDDVKIYKKNKDITEDEVKVLEDQIQKSTDKYTKMIDNLLDKKITEMLN